MHPCHYFQFFSSSSFNEFPWLCYFCWSSAVGHGDILIAVYSSLHIFFCALAIAVHSSEYCSIFWVVLKRRYGTYNETTQRSVILSGKKMPFKLDFSSFSSIFVDCKVSAWHGFVFPQPSSFLRYNLFSQMIVKHKKKRCQHTNANELICLIILYLQPFNEKIEQKAVKLKGMMMVVFVCVCAR